MRASGVGVATLPNAEWSNKRLGVSADNEVVGLDLAGRPADTPSSLPSATRARMLPTPVSKDFMATPGETPDSLKYSAREQKLTVLSTMNDALAAAQPSDRASSRCEIKLLQGIQRSVPHRFMFERVEQKCAALRERLRSVTDGIVQANKLGARALQEDGADLQMTPVSMPAQDKAWFCGRICCEGDSGSINASSVLLEGANGKRVRLDLAHVAQFAVFPGQIVVVRGNNTSGECITVREMWSDAALPMAKTPADKMATWNETDEFLGGEPLSILTASGPFTSSVDLAYKPLEDLMDHIAEQKPDVVILTGPFVDCRHKQLNPDAAGQVGGFSEAAPDSLQVVRRVMRDIILERLAAGSPTTKCVLVPCLDDLHSRSTFPQPPFDEAEILQAAEGESDRAHRVDVQLMGNPCVLRINEIIVGICTSDPVRSLSGNEASRAPGDRITRLANHILQQRSFYPLFPPAEGCQMSMAHSGLLRLEQTPDVLLLPSQLNAFAKRIGDVLCVNPGKLTKGNGAGTFARFSVHPVVRHLRSGPAGGSRKVTAGLALSPSAAAESPDKDGAEDKADQGGASSAAAAVSPQQLSQNFDSAVGEGGDKGEAADKPAEEETPAEQAGSSAPHEAPAAQVAMEGKEEGQAVPDVADNMMQVDAEAAVPSAAESAVAGGEAGAPALKSDESSSSKALDEVKVAAPATASAPQPTRADAKAEVFHRVCERTRVEIVRI